MVTELKSVIVFMFPLLCLFVMLFPVVVMEVVILCIWGGNFPYVSVCVQRATGRSFQYFLTKISHKVYFNNISNYFFCFFEKSYFSFFWNFFRRFRSEVYT